MFLAEYQDRSFHNPTELKQYTVLPVLATIPLMITVAEQRRQRRKKLLLYSTGVLGPIATLCAVHVFWMKLDLVIARTLQYLKP